VSVLLSLVQFLLWFQPPATGSGGGGGGAAAATGTGGGSNLCLMNAGIMLAVLAFTYLFMIRPEQKRREEADTLLKSLRKGMKVRTTGGILGEIISLTDHEVVLGIADKVRINVLRTHIAGPEVDRTAVTTKDAAKEKSAGTPAEIKDDKGKKPDEARS
jgi:preprotein translocase subunit YajC